MTRLEKKDVLRIAKQMKVKFIRLFFTDILGFLKSLAITVCELEGALEEGVKKRYPLRDPVERNVYEMTKEERKKYKIESLPEDLYEAIQITEKSELVRQTLGDHVFHQYVENDKIEWGRYRAQVTDYELEQYLAIL